MGGAIVIKTEFKKGYFQVYTGNCKGKTTAALGLAFRAVGRGLKVYIGQFMKGQDYGELRTAKLLKEYITMEQFGEKTFLTNAKNSDKNMAKEGLLASTAAMLSGKYDIVIFDEICMAHFFKLLTYEDLVGVIKQKPSDVELIFTGRYAAKEIIEMADLVTEMKEVKHYYTDGVMARVGIEM